MTKQVDEGLSGRNNVEIESKLPCEVLKNNWK